MTWCVVSGSMGMSISEAKVARAHALEVEPRDQFLKALGPAQIRRQNLRGKLFLFASGPPVMHPWLLDVDRPYAGRDRPSRHTAIAYHLAMPLVITHVAVQIDPAGDLRLDSLGQEMLGSLPQYLAQNVLALKNWNNCWVERRTIHGGVLLCPRRALVSCLIHLRVRRPFQSPIHKIWLYLAALTARGLPSAAAPTGSSDVPETTTMVRRSKTKERLRNMLPPFCERASPSNRIAAAQRGDLRSRLRRGAEGSAAGPQ